MKLKVLNLTLGQTFQIMTNWYRYTKVSYTFCNHKNALNYILVKFTQMTLSIFHGPYYIMYMQLPYVVPWYLHAGHSTTVMALYVGYETLQLNTYIMHNVNKTYITNV